jgi:hypothetical protein
MQPHGSESVPIYLSQHNTEWSTCATFLKAKTSSMTTMTLFDCDSESIAWWKKTAGFHSMGDNNIITNGPSTMNKNFRLLLESTLPGNKINAFAGSVWEQRRHRTRLENLSSFCPLVNINVINETQ